ncbi:hypothetical protein M0R88_07780 [Halorussus gelatinilyticus]|uniref:Uncharacterized protein n=1 Tax=Halorussus gelatinilyticus TaxID=2937524 RepID=A0A8U0IPB0_9EURY|nr:hypothetical protein [Halorussus gelatinilyticus]UPW01984.1 hypothetical protein M0R88_07780 [Halorussus gelatinilyticus]
MSHKQPEVVDLRTGPRTASLVSTGYGVETGAGVQLEWVATATGDSPAVLRATVTNLNEFRTKFRTSSLPPFARVNLARLREPQHSEAEGIYLAPTEENPLVEESPGYERRENGHWHATEVPPEQPESLWLDPDESVVGEYYLLGHPDEADVAPGRYHFGSPSEGFSIAVWDTDAPGPNVDSQFAGADFPPLPDADAMAWYHEADATTEVYLEPSAEATVVPGRLDFEFVNRSHEVVEGNPLEWHLYELSDGEWYRVAPEMTPLPATHLYPGNTRTDALRVFYGEPVPCEDGHDVGHLGGGRYAFTVGMDDGVTHAVAFDLLGDPVAVTPSDAIVSVERDGDSLTATSARGDPDEEWSRPATYTLARVDTPPADAEPRRLIAEQVLRRDRLRDAIGLLREHDAEAVTIREYDSGQPPFGVDEPYFVAYDGDAYRIATEADE